MNAATGFAVPIESEAFSSFNRFNLNIKVFVLIQSNYSNEAQNFFKITIQNYINIDMFVKIVSLNSQIRYETSHYFEAPFTRFAN